MGEDEPVDIFAGKSRPLWLSLPPEEFEDEEALAYYEVTMNLFCRRALKKANLRDIELLGMVGAFDSLVPDVPRYTWVMNASLMLAVCKGEKVLLTCRCEGCGLCKGKLHHPSKRKSARMEYTVDTAKSRAGKGEPARRVGFVCCYCRFSKGEIGNPNKDGGKNCEKIGHKDGPPSGLQKANFVQPQPWPTPAQPTAPTQSPWAFRASASKRGTGSAPSPSSQSRSFFASGPR